MKIQIICSICGDFISGKDYCAEPVNSGRCCEKCRKEVVVPRIKEFLKAINEIDQDLKLENWTIEEQTGYKVKTTFYTDFSIAERYGIDAIRSTFEQSFEEWKDNCEYITELCMVLNWKMFRWFENNDKLFNLYKELYTRLDRWCIENLKGDDLEYYYKTTD